MENQNQNAQPQKITASMILADLQAGLTRDDIGIKYGLNKTQVKAMFKNSSLKFKKTIKEKAASFIFEDDLAENTNTQPATFSQPVSENTMTNRSENIEEVTSSDDGIL